MQADVGFGISAEWRMETNLYEISIQQLPNGQLQVCSCLCSSTIGQYSLRREAFSFRPSIHRPLTSRIHGGSSFNPPSITECITTGWPSSFSTDFLQATASESDAIENSTLETDSQTNNEWVDPSPQHALDHFDPIPTGANRFFLDICAGASRPLSSAILALHGDVCSFDILLHPSDDLLPDAAYERLLRLASSGLIAYGCGSPACRDYSRLKLRPNGPKVLRTPEHLNGVPGLTAFERRRVRDSACMLSRTIMILTRVFLAGGHVHLEQPQNAMSWLEPVAQSFIRHIAFHCVVIAACCYDANWDKAWLFAASWDNFQSLAGTCQHPRGSHESVIGTRDSDGSFRSRKTAGYPKQLAISIANLVLPLISENSLDLSLSEALKYMPLKLLQDFPFSSEDGGGLHSTPDWSLPDRTSSDVFESLRHSLFDFILSKQLHKEFLANIAKKLSDPPFTESVVDEARKILSEFLQQHSKPADWTIREHQPMYLSIMHSLQFFMPDEDVPLFPSLIEGVSTGFHSDVAPSGFFPPNDKPDLPSTLLSIHLANWQSAEKEPQTTLELVDEEVKQGWVYKFQGSIDDAKQHFSHVAIGRLGVAFSDSHPPRLVVDSSVCGLNDRCKIPERTTLPSAKDVIRCFPLRNNSRELSGFSLDVKSAHKRVVLKESEQGLLGFSLNDSLYFYRVCPFGRHLAHIGGNVLVDGFSGFSTKLYGFPMHVGYTLTITCGCNIVTSFHWWLHSLHCCVVSSTYQLAGKNGTWCIHSLDRLVFSFFCWLHRYSQKTRQTDTLYSTVGAPLSHSTNVSWEGDWIDHVDHSTISIYAYLGKALVQWLVLDSLHQL